MTEIPTLTVSTRTNTEQTDILARLMATEDITIRHERHAETASFNVATRVLTLPVWEEMSGALYDMLTMHEVGHALHTPADGWASCDIIDTNKRNHPLVQMFYNIVEDARIERLMMEQFPGGVNDFRAAYDNLHNERDLFELAGKDIDALGLADRVNIHFKLGQFDLVEVNFTAEEQVFVDAINATRTWEDVVDATRDLYNYCKEQDKNNPTPEQDMPEQGAGDAEMPEMGNDEGDSDGPKGMSVPNFDHSEDEDTNETGAGAEGGEESDEDAGEDGESGSTGEDGDGDESEGEGSTESKGDGTAESADDAEDDGSNAESTEGEDVSAAGAEASKGGGENNVNVPQTVAAQDRNMSALNNDMGMDVLNLGAPKISDTAVTDWTVIHKDDNAKFATNYCIGTSFVDGAVKFDAARCDSAYANFINQNKKTINKMAQQFEMKKAADAFKRTSISKSGRLDTTKMINYRWSEDIFAKNTTVSDGKNHGLIMVIDWSGSMSGNMKSTIEQAMCLALFCKKVQIPFEVYSFTSTDPTTAPTEYDTWGCDQEATINIGGHELRGAWLNNYLSSRMSKMEFVRCMKNMIMLAEAMDSYGRRGMHSLGGTPLNESLLILRDTMNAFKRDNNIQIAHTVYLTDGEGYGGFLGGYRTQTTWRDGSFKWTHDGENRCNETEVCLDWYKKTTGSRVVNFFLTGSINRHMKYTYCTGDEYGEMETQFKEMKRIFKKENMYSVGEHGGYDETFIIKSNIETTNESGMEGIGTDATNARLKSAFVKGQNARVASRALLNRFTDLIAD